MISLRINTPALGQVDFSLDVILDALGVKEADDSVCALILTRNDRSLLAVASDDLQYPGITLDGTDEHKQSMFLAQVELPNEDYPDTVCARLYAGYSECETDAPIALVKTELMTPREVADRAARPEQTKTVYLDTVFTKTDEYDNAARKDDSHV